MVFPPGTTRPSISLNGISRRRGETQVLDKIDLEHDGPGVIGLVGRNGAGKTSLLRVVAQLLCPDEGTVTICGHIVDVDNARARALVGFAPHEPFLRKGRSLRANLELSARLASVVGNPAQVADAQLQRWDLASLAERDVDVLSRGELQRAALAQADLGSPPILLLDEPTTGLDYDGMRLLSSAIKRWHETRLTIVSSHDREWIDSVSSWVFDLDEAQVAAWA
jgi:ABC-type multidrug transport system ATPase subunit